MRKSERIDFPYGLSGDFARLLRKYDRLRRSLDILRDASLMTVALGAFILAACLFDRFVDVAGYWRAPLPWMALAVFLFFMGRMVLRVTRRRDYDNIAHTLDRLSGDRYDHLRSLLDFARRGLSATFFLTRVQTCAAHHWQGKNTRQFIDQRPVRRIAVWAGVTLALTAALWNVPYSRADLLLRRFLNPLGNYMRPSATWFDVQPLPATPVYSGDDLTIGARLCGRKVKKPVPLIKIVNEDGSTITRNMEPTPDNGWQVPLKNLQKSFVWYLCVDDARSARYKAPVLSRPAIIEAIVTYTYPKYSGLKKKTETLKGRAITALDGTKVMLKIRSNIALRNAIGRFEDDTVRFRINRKNSREAVVYQIVNKNTKMKPELISSTGVASKQELPFIFRVVPDSPPSINWRTQLNGKTFYLTDLLKISYRAEDDLGLASVELRVEDARRSQLQDARLIDLDMEQYGSRVAEGETSLPVAELHREKINSLRLTLVARDTKDQEGLSRGATITIATDSFDRQLRGALQYYSREGFMRGQNAVAYHAEILKRLKLVKSNLMILEDTLKAGAPLSDQHKELVKKINADLGAIQLPSLYGTHWFFNIQHASLLPRFRDCLEYASVWSCLAVNGEELRENAAAALSSPNARSAIQKLTPFLDENIGLQEKTAARVTADYAMLARELAGYLAASMEFQIKNAENGKLHDENFRLNARTALGEICDLATNVLASETPPEYLQKLAGYLAENENEDGMLLREVLPALAGFKKALMPKTREAIVQKAAEKDILSRSLLERSLLQTGYIDHLGIGLYLMGDNFGGDDTFTLQCAARYFYLDAKKQNVSATNARIMNERFTAAVAEERRADEVKKNAESEFADKSVTAKAMADKVSPAKTEKEKAESAKAAVDKLLAAKSAAAQTASQNENKLKEQLSKAVKEREQAQKKPDAAKEAEAKAAVEKTLAEQLPAANTESLKAKTEQEAAAKVAAEKAAAAKTALEAFNAATAAAEKAAAEKAAAGKKKAEYSAAAEVAAKVVDNLKKDLFYPPGNSDTSMRHRAEDLFNLFQALNMTFAQSAYLRLGITSGYLPAGGPETETAWLALREQWLALIALEKAASTRDAQFRESLRLLLANMEALLPWLPSDSIRSPEFLQTMTAWETECARLAGALVPDIKPMLARMGSESAARFGVIIAALEHYRQDVSDEIARRTSATDKAFHSNFFTLKIRLMGIAIGAMTMLDFVRQAEIYGAGKGVDVVRLVILNAALSKIVEYHENKIEEYYREPTREGWIHLYGKLEEKVGMAHKLATSPVADPSNASVAEILKKLGIDGIVAQAMAEMRKTEEAGAKIADRKSLLSSYCDNPRQAPAVWDEINFRMCLVRELLTEKAAAPRLKKPAKEMRACVEKIEKMPKELRDLPDFLENVTRDAQVDPERHAARLEQANAILQEMKALVNRHNKRRPGAVAAGTAHRC